MGGFYGYSPENFMPDNSVWSKVGGIAAETLMKLPEAIELEKSIEEGRQTNKDVYDATILAIKDLDDDTVKTYFGRSKEELMKIGKPGRNEGTEYLVRNTKIFGDGLTKVMAKKNLGTAQSEIVAPNKSDEKLQNMSPAIAGPISAFNQALGKPEPSSPEQVQSIARKYNVPLDQLQPEMTQAKNRVDAQQLRQIDFDKTMGENIANIGGQGQGVGENTMKAIATTQTKGQQEASKIAAKNAASAGVKADADNTEAKAKLKGEENKGNEQLFKNLKDYLKGTEDAMAKAQDDYTNLQKILATTYDQDRKDDVLKQMKAINSKIQKYTTEIEKTREQMRPKIDIKEEEKQTRNASESTKKDTLKILNYVKSNDSDYETGIFNYAKTVEQTTGKTLGITVEKLRTLLDPSLPEDQRATVSQIVQAIRQQAGLE
jgi:hypothetical protein